MCIQKKHVKNSRNAKNAKKTTNYPQAIYG